MLHFRHSPGRILVVLPNDHHKHHCAQDNLTLNQKLQHTKCNLNASLEVLKFQCQ